MQYRKLPIRVLVSTLLVNVASAEDWPQYLGPTRHSISPQRGILRSWPEKGPEVLWTVPVGRGYGGPVIMDGGVMAAYWFGELAPKCRNETRAFNHPAGVSAGRLCAWTADSALLAPSVSGRVVRWAYGDVVMPAVVSQE